MKMKSSNKSKGPIFSSNFSKFELEIEKLRNENKWSRLREYARSLPSKDPKYARLAKLSIAESELEQFLFSNPIAINLTTSTVNTSADSSGSSSDSQAPSSSVSTSSHALYEVEQLCKELAQTRSDKVSAQLEAQILLAKLFFAQARYDESNKQLASTLLQQTLADHLNTLKAQLSQQAFIGQVQFDLPRTDSLRQKQLFAEAHTLKALSLERLRNETSNKDYDQSIIDSYEMASLFAINHSVLMCHYTSSSSSTSAVTPTVSAAASGMQSTSGTNFQSAGSAGTALSASSGTTSANAATQEGSIMNLALNMASLSAADDNLDLINPFYEIALQKAPLLYIRRGDLQLGMKKFRDLLLKKNIQSITSIRQVLLKKFAECLIFNIPKSQYCFLRLTGSDDRFKLFKPTNQDEEILLCLLLSQHLASKEVTLFRHAQFKQIRDQSFLNALTSLDLLTFYLAYHKSYGLLLESFDMTWKYSFEQFFVWYQHGLTLVNDGKFQKAYLVLKECSRMRPDHVTCHLLLAKLAIENLFLMDEAIDWCKRVLELTNYRSVKANILLGCALCLKAKLQKQHSVQINFYEQALDSFKKANFLDPCDYLSLYYMAHCFAILRLINEALDSIQKALKFKPDDKDSLHLLTLILTSMKNYDSALTVITKACSLYEDFELLFTKIRIEEILFGFNKSIQSLFNLIILYKKKLKPIQENSNGSRTSSSITMSNSAPVTGILSNKNNATGVKSVTQNTEYWNTFESASLLNLQHNYKLNEVIGKTITMLVNSDQLALKYGSSTSTSTNMNQLLILIRILTQIGEFYLRHNKLNDAELCCQEIATYHSMSYLHLYLKGRIFEFKQDYVQAKICYQNALSINPYHIQSLQQMSLVLCQLQNFHLAEKMIRDAISLNSASPDSWQLLARVLDYQNDNQSAMKCYQTSLQLEATNPILPFTSLTRFI